MNGHLTTGEWASHIVVACVACEKAILLWRRDRQQAEGARALQLLLDLMPMSGTGVSTRRAEGGTPQHVNVFVPAVCAACAPLSSWITFALCRPVIEAWRTYQAARDLLEEDLILLGHCISVVHGDQLKLVMGQEYLVQSLSFDYEDGPTAELESHLQSGFL